MNDRSPSKFNMVVRVTATDDGVEFRILRDRQNFCTRFSDVRKIQGRI
jgi:hypothetical protein